MAASTRSMGFEFHVCPANATTANAGFHYGWVDWNNARKVPCSKEQQQHLLNTELGPFN